MTENERGDKSEKPLPKCPFSGQGKLCARELDGTPIPDLPVRPDFKRILTSFGQSVTNALWKILDPVHFYEHAVDVFQPERKDLEVKFCDVCVGLAEKKNAVNISIHRTY